MSELLNLPLLLYSAIPAERQEAELLLELANDGKLSVSLALLLLSQCGFQ